MAKYKNYEYVGKNGKKDYRKTVLLDRNNEIINVSYSKKRKKCWYAADNYTYTDIQIYGRRDIEDITNTIFITNNEEDTEILNNTGVSAINFAHTMMEERELMDYLPRLFKNFKKVFILDDFLESLRDVNYKGLKQTFLEKLSKLPNIKEIIILDPRKVHYMYKTINDIVKINNKNGKCEEEFLQLIKTSERYK